MKQFACGNVVPGCAATFAGATDDDVLAAVAQHAQQDHGMVSVPDGVVEQVRRHILTV